MTGPTTAPLRSGGPRSKPLGGLRGWLRRWIGGAVEDVDESRSRRMVVVIECILNQNARDQGAARFPAMNTGVVVRCTGRRGRR